MRHHSVLDPGYPLLMAFLVAAASVTASAGVIAELSDPVAPAIDASVDIISAWVEQNGGQLTFGIETRGMIPVDVPMNETLTFLWLIDADDDASTGQPHGDLGSEFNIRAVVSPMDGGGFVDVTGTLPGGGGGLPVTISGNRIEITLWLSLIAAPSRFRWRCDAGRVVDGIVLSNNGETEIAEASLSLYTPPARVTVTTPMILLNMAGPSSEKLGVTIRDAAGNVLPNAEHVLKYRSTNEASVTVDATGRVTAHSAPLRESEVAYVLVWADDVMADNAAVVRVTQADLGLAYQAYAGKYVVFDLPPTIEGVDLAALTAEYQVVEMTDRAYAAEQAGVGGIYLGGGTLYLVLDVADIPGAAPCGASGSPIRLGWEYGKSANNSCYIVNDPSHRTPQWFVIFHEMGHDFTMSCNAFNMFLWSPSSNHNAAYCESMASLAAMWSWQDIITCPGTLDPMAVADMHRHLAGYMSSWRQSLIDYRSSGANYADLSADVLDGILLDLYDRYGPKVWFGLFSSFLPAPAPLPYAMDTVEKQATWFVAAVSASAGVDLRDTFRSDYGFPIDDEAWPDIWPIVQSRVAARAWSAHVPADLDCDGRVDAADLLLLQACVTGSEVPYPTGDPPWCCGLAPNADGFIAADLDRDGDVDQMDFGVFQRCWNGLMPADPNCLN